MIDPSHKLPVCHQAELLDLSRSAVYYRAVPVSDDDLAVMRRIDELHLEHPFAGSRMLKRLLRTDGFDVGRSHVRTLMRRMGIEAIYRRPRTSQPHPDHRVFPYLLRNQVIDRPNQVWALDITYIPMRRGFVYLVAVLDWSSRRVLAWQLSNTLTADFCVEAFDRAKRRYGTPDIVNTDQGAQPLRAALDLSMTFNPQLSHLKIEDCCSGKPDHLCEPSLATPYATGSSPP